MTECEKCGNKTILAEGTLDRFLPDPEPYESGKIEDCGFEEIAIDKSVWVSVQWCPKCGHLVINNTEVV